jgi:hypothetical protein
VAVNVGNCIWRFLSSDTKKNIKNALGFGKPEPESSPENRATHDSCELTKAVFDEEEPIYISRLFTTCDHSAVIKKMDHSSRKEYLSSYISNKLNTLEQRPKNEKNEQKIVVLQLLEQVVKENKHLPDKGKLHKKYPRVIDNFWCEKSDTDQLIDAVTYYVKSNHKTQQIEALNQVTATQTKYC